MVMKNLLVISALIAVCFASCQKEDDDNNQPEKKLYKVKYNIGCSDCQVIYVSDSLGAQTTEYNQNSSWTYSFYGKLNQEILLLAYNTSSAPQGVNVKIAVNDSILSDRTTYCAISGVSFAADTIR
jgi:hypothetical protein